MPIYEYVCSKCGHEMECIQKFSDPPETQCPECGKKSLVKQVSAAGFKLTGGGWYETDFKDKKPEPKEEGGSEKKTEKSGKKSVKKSKKKK